MAKDFLDEIMAEESGVDPTFPDLVAQALARREVARELAQAREAKKLSQTELAARMKTSASVISKLENGADVKLSTIQKYLSLVGGNISLLSKLVPDARPAARRSKRKQREYA